MQLGLRNRFKLIGIIFLVENCRGWGVATRWGRVGGWGLLVLAYKALISFHNQLCTHIKAFKLLIWRRLRCEPSNLPTRAKRKLWCNGWYRTARTSRAIFRRIGKLAPSVFHQPKTSKPFLLSLGKIGLSR